MLEKLWYDQEAKELEAALPIGNGSFGAIVYSGVETEKLSLSHDSFWSGYPREIDYDRREEMTKVKALMLENKVYEAEQIIDKKVVNNITDTFIPGLDMFLSFPHKNAENYKRELDLTTALLTTNYTADDNKLNYETFASYKAQVIAYKVESEKAIDLSCYFESVHPLKTCCYEKSLSFVAKAPSYITPFYWKGNGQESIYDDDENNRSILLSTCVHFDTDGEISIKDGKTNITNAKYLIIYIKMDSSFVDHKTLPRQSMEDEIKRDLAFIEKLDYEAVKKEHLEDYQELYSRASINITDDKYSYLPTDKRVSRQTESHDDKSLIELMWAYGRYLLIANSREGSKCSNLQGIWNNVQYPDWSSGYTININIQMNYWLSEITNLSECHTPFFEFVKDMSDSGKLVAENFYGCRGWCSHHKTDIWKIAMPCGGRATHAFWPMSAGWLILHIWEHFLFTNDKEFLKEYYPTMKGAALFLMDWFSPDNNGDLAVFPSTSPENRYILGDTEISVDFNSAMDIGITNGVIDMCIGAEKALGITDLSQDLEIMKEKMPKYKIGSLGQLLEWGDEYEERDIKHRHISPLYGLYPANGIKSSDKELIDACKVFMERREAKTGGWGLAWRMAIFARLKNGDKAYEIATNILRLLKDKDNHSSNGGGMYMNLYDGTPEFQIDGSFGYTAGITEMLIQSHEDKIDLLPALPTDWKDGSFNGLRARGNVTVDCVWKDNELSSATLYFANAGDYVVAFKEKEVKIHCDEAMKITVDSNLKL